MYSINIMPFREHIPMTHNDFLETRTDGVQSEWLDNRRDHNPIVVFTFHDFAPTTVDVWFAQCLSCINNATNNAPLIGLHDVSDAALVLTCFMVDRVRTLLKAHGQHPGRHAIIVSRSIMAQMINAVVKAHRRPNTEIRVFFSRDEGLAWLYEDSLTVSANFPY